MKGFIFAAGFGERLRPITELTPKPLLPVLNVPAICYAVSLLKEVGITDIIVNLHYRSKDIINFFEKNNYFGVNITFSYEEIILGTGGGVKRCEKLLSDDDFVIINSDIITDINISRVIEEHNSSRSPATLVLFETEMAGEIGRIGVRDKFICDFKNFLETGLVSDYIYAGAAVLSPLIFDYLTPYFSSIVYTGYVDLVRKHSVNYYDHRGFWHDIGDHSSYYNVNVTHMNDAESLKQRLTDTVGITPVAVSPEAFIDESASVKGSVIGAGVSIGAGSVIENSLVLQGSVIPPGTSVKGSIVWGDEIRVIKK